MGDTTTGGEASAALSPPLSEPARAAEADEAAPTVAAPVRNPAAESGLLPLPLAVATFWLTFWCVAIVSPELPELRDSLGLSDTLGGLVFSAFFAGRLVSNLPAAILVDFHGARPTALVGAGLLVAGSVGAAVAGGLIQATPAG